MAPEVTICSAWLFLFPTKCRFLFWLCSAAVRFPVHHLITMIYCNLFCNSFGTFLKCELGYFGILVKWTLRNGFAHANVVRILADKIKAKNRWAEITFTQIIPVFRTPKTYENYILLFFKSKNNRCDNNNND